MSLVVLIAGAIAMCAVVSALLVSQSCKRLTLETAAMSESLSIYADRLMAMAERLLPLEASVRRLEAQFHELRQSYTLPNDLFPQGQQPLPDSDEVTPTQRPRKSKRK